MSATIAPPIEQRDTFACFGSSCTLIVGGGSEAQDAAALANARRRLEAWHEQFSRFRSDSELTRLNRNPAETVLVSPLMRRVVEAGVQAARATDGLVDPTLLTQIEQAGYRSHYDGPGVPLPSALAMAPARRPGRPAAEAHWRLVSTDRRTSSVTRPAGVQIDPG
ncbi:MAG TPA: FAD:protein FMN transferase, partial [Solirubrobacteraceae bacterium]|nr:FAD:protein FMN transferase [Solirubrobacteraceae bacterium]